jgi:hypothetical protein
MTCLLQRAAAAKGSHGVSATVGVKELTKTSRILARELETGLCVVSFTPGEGDGEGAGAEGGWGQGVAFEAVAQYEEGGLALVLTPEEAKVLLETRMETPVETRMESRKPCHSPHALGGGGVHDQSRWEHGVGRGRGGGAMGAGAGRRGGAGAGAGAGGADGGRERREDWTCPECEVMCFGSKTVCFQVRILKSQYTVALCSKYSRALTFENFSCSAAPCVLSWCVKVMPEVMMDGRLTKEGVDCQRERERR